MTIQIPKSMIDGLGFDFDQAVADFIAAKEAHRFTGDAAPTAHPLVEQVVQRISYPIDAKKPDDFRAEYEILDDTPPPPTIEQIKDSLAVELGRRHVAARNAVVSPARLNLLIAKIGAETDKEKAAALRSQLDAYQASLSAIDLRTAEIAVEIEDLADGDEFEFPPL